VTSAISRAPSIPEPARYDAQRQQWEVCEIVEGVRHGPFQQWRVDGSCAAVGVYVHGKLHGKLQRLHPNGDVAWEGNYVDGKLEGEVVATASTEPSPERLRECCVPASAWQMRTVYEQGRSRGDRFFDREGRRLLADGRLLPERPPHLPDHAWFEENAYRWACGVRDEQRRQQGEWIWWFAEGTLCEVGWFSDGKRTGVWRTFSEQGQPREVVEFSEGVRHGAFTNYAMAAGELLDPRIREVTGHVAQLMPVGPWEFRDSEGQLLKRIDLGVLPTETVLRDCGVFLDVESPATGGTWENVAARLFEERQLGAALCALARGAARSGTVEVLRTALLEHTCELSPQRGAQLLKTRRGVWPELVHLLAWGAAPVDTLRALATAIPFAKRAARDFLEAGLLLADDSAAVGSNSELRLARALNRLEFGNLQGALADADVLGQRDAAAGRFVRAFAEVLFGEFRFVPLASDLPEGSFEELPSCPAQPLSVLNGAISKAALRLTQVRAALQRLYAESKLMAIALPPDVSHLVQGDVSLRQWQFDIEEEGQAVKIAVDERLTVDVHSAVALLSRARVEWTALCWLCWSAGLGEVAQPQALNPPTNFNQALGQSVQRYWRCKDQVATAGLLARRQGVPGFRWREHEVSTLSGPLLQMASNEYLEQRAILLWLADDQCQSPWQDDLRPA
jgi:hypothetical protein